MRLLIVWCLGGNWGHVSRQLGVARHAGLAGMDVLWAVPASRAAAVRPVRALGHRVLISPDANPPATPPRQGAPRSFADVLADVGFGDEPALEQQVTAWLRLYHQVQPDCVLLDYAPAAQLAAQLAGLRALQVTNGFEAPPAACPAYEAHVRGPYLQQRAATQAHIVDTTVAALARRLAPNVRTGLRGFIEYPRLLVNCVLESAPYGSDAAWRRRSMDVVGPLGLMPDAKPALWPAAADGARARRVFAYLRGTHPHFDTILRSLQDHAASTLCVWPDAPSALLEATRCATHLRVTREPVDVAEALARADAVVSCGSGTFSTQALLAGKPQLMLPTDHEKLLVAEQVQRCGLGWVATKAMSASAAVQRLQEVLAGERLAATAAEAAARYRELPAHAAATIAMRLREATLAAN